MSKPDKHKPTSAEELFKLLDSSSDNSINSEEFDDFEKDAFEGFSNHSNANKAKILTEELNLAISKKIADTTKGGSKNKIIWFSAAASIVLIIVISIFFLNQTKNDSESNIVLNEVKNDENAQSTSILPIEASEENKISTESDKVEEKSKSQEIIISKNGRSEGTKSTIMESTIALAETFTNTKDQSKNRNDGDIDALAKKEVSLEEKSQFKKKDNSNKEKLESTSVAVADENGSAAIAQIDETDKLTNNLGKESASKKAIESEMESEKSIKFENANSIISKKSVTLPATSATISNEYSKPSYTGNELAIKEYILSYFKSKQIVKPIFGSFKIFGNVNLKGELTVSEIIQIKEKECSCKEEIKKALNTMKKWNTAKQNGNAISSSVEFTLLF
ncbi:MAG: hypothetical protein K9H41_01020 [Bacteroidia bacterium]|nr:hypothetical protein [Bacteroidia bacterium]